MNDPTRSTTGVPPTPGERAAVAADDRTEADAPSPPPQPGAGAAVSGDTVDNAVVDVGGGGAVTAASGDGEAVSPQQHAATINAGGEVEIECPGCGLILVGDTPRPTAAWFCPRCDYPAFWAAPPAPEPTPQRRARRRLPGTNGTQVVGAEPCWNCGEPNEPDVTSCVRCAAQIPKPMVQVVERIVEVDRPIPVPFVVTSVTWPYVAAGVLGGAAIATAATLWIVRLAGAAPLVGGLG